MRFKYNHYKVKLRYNVTKGTEYFVLLQTSVVLTKEYTSNVRLTVRNYLVPKNVRHYRRGNA